MSFPYSQLRQTATYWPITGYDKFNDPIVGDPVLLSPSNSNWGVRWEDRIEKFISNAGDELHSRSVIYSVYPIDNDGFLYLGTSTEADPDDVDGADQIRQAGAVPHLRKTSKILYRAYV